MSITTLMKITKMITRVTSPISTNSPQYEFRDFLENDHSENGYFREKF